MKYRFALLFTFFIQFCLAQKTYTLEECITLALQNSNTVQLARLDKVGTEINKMTSKNNLLPTANAGLGHGLNFGRSIDPATNDFVNEQIARGGFSGSVNWQLWQNGSNRHALKQSQYADEAARWTIKNSEDNLRLQVILAYLQVLNAREQTTIAEQQEQITSQQNQRLQNMSALGAVLPGQLADITAQLASDKMALLNAQQNTKGLLLTLCQLMNIPFDPSMNLSSVSNDISNNTETNQVRTRGMNHAAIKASEFAIQASEFDLKSAKASRYPSLQLSTDLGSNYSSAFEVNYIKQLNTNFNYSGFLSLNIPILGNNSFVRRNIRMAQNNIDRAKTNASFAQTTIQQNIEQAILMYENATERYNLAQSQMDAFAEAFRIAEVRLNEGVSNSVVEYLLAKNNFSRSQNQMTTAKYERNFRDKVLDFYAKL